MMARTNPCVLGLYALLVSQSTMLHNSVDLRWGCIGFPPIFSGMSCDGPEHGAIMGWIPHGAIDDHNEINVEKK